MCSTKPNGYQHKMNTLQDGRQETVSSYSQAFQLSKFGQFQLFTQTHIFWICQFGRTIKDTGSGLNTKSVEVVSYDFKLGGDRHFEFWPN